MYALVILAIIAFIMWPRRRRHVCRKGKCACPKCVGIDRASYEISNLNEIEQTPKPSCDGSAPDWMNNRWQADMSHAGNSLGAHSASLNSLNVAPRPYGGTACVSSQALRFDAAVVY